MNPTNSNFCAECGKPVPPNSPHQLCPACMMAQAIASQTQEEKRVPSAAVPEPEEIAGKFPQFEIFECLGRGGMGVVYKARQKSLNRLVAIKILAPEREHDAGFAMRFAREAELLAKLSHPHIVTIHDFGETGGLYYLVMEFVDGVSLRDLLREGKLEPKQALAIVPEICDALQFAHDHGVVHRDIKPENILLDRLGRVKVADFGLAKLVGGDNETTMGESASGSPGFTESGKIMGTLQYMAPEQAAHPLEVDRRADIYSLGVVFYQMLTGELPGKPIEAPSKKVRIDVRLDEVVLRALEKKPELRYQQVSEVKTLVETIVATPDSTGRQGDGSQSNKGEPEIRSVATPVDLHKEKLFIGFATPFFILMLVFLPGVALEYPRQATTPIIGMAMCAVGLVVCGLRLAGLWPFPSLLFPKPNFSSRNLDGLRGDSFASPSVGSGDSDEINRRREGQILGGSLGFALMALGMAINITPFQPFGLGILIWGLLFSALAIALLLAAGNSSAKLKFAWNIMLINGIGLFFAVIPLSLDCPWMRRTNSHLLIIAACIFGITACLRHLVMRANPEDNAGTKRHARFLRVILGAIGGGLAAFLIAGVIRGSHHPETATTTLHAASPNLTVQQTVGKAVETISQCAEGDPRVAMATSSLILLDNSQVVSALVPFLDSPSPTLRRSAIYIFQVGGFRNIGPAIAPLQKLLNYSEDYTRGMAALALGQNREKGSFDRLVSMARDDASGYARRCAVWALGLLGDERAIPVLKSAQSDADPSVRQNAGAALVFLEKRKAGLAWEISGKNTALNDNPSNRSNPPVATPQNPVLESAEKWLSLIDDGNYPQSWEEAAAIFHGGVSKESWENSMETFRKPLGKLVSRKVQSVKPLTEIPGAPDGHYVVMQFDTSFTDKKSAVETVTFMQEKDGIWKSAGYFIK